MRMRVGMASVSLCVSDEFGYIWGYMVHYLYGFRETAPCRTVLRLSCQIVAVPLKSELPPERRGPIIINRLATRPGEALHTVARHLAGGHHGIDQEGGGNDQ